MNRIVDYKYSELIGAAFEIIPRSIADRIRYTHFLTGVDPVYAGLHAFTDTGDNRSYRNTAHVAYPWHQRLAVRHTTVVLPSLVPLHVVVHELGHVLDESLGFSWCALPVSEYAQKNRGESFAEAFTAWLFWGFENEIDEATKMFFERL